MEYKEVKFKTDCWRCSTEMMYNSGDIIDGRTRDEIECPVCGITNLHRKDNRIK